MARLIIHLADHKPVLANMSGFGQAARGANDKFADAAATTITTRALAPNGITVVLGESSGGLPALKAAAFFETLG